MNWKRLKKWLFILLAVYVAIGAAFYFLQDRFLFRPVRLENNTPFSFPGAYREINIPVNERETIHLVKFLPDSQAKGMVLYFHGNKRNIGWYARYTREFTRHGYEVLMLDYPGFGKSQGKLTEKKLYEWALQAYRLAMSSYPADSIVIYGKSMGTGIAAWLASARDCRRLILETPYYDLPSAVQHYLPVYPVHWMLHYQLPTYQYLPSVKAPVTIFQGTRDRVIPYRNAARLKPLLKKEDEFVTVKKGRHNDLFDHALVKGKLDSLLRR
ncbi:MAG TPA: alpha/beta fold hydrolase [Chitinophagaceae bacterium]|nr:alpha/beta fold hydrolase [Chitinophagaceae bacterium]